MSARDHRAPLEPFGMLDEAPLPERYGTPRIHVAARDPKTLFIYWEAPVGIQPPLTVRFEILRHERGEHREAGEHHDIRVDAAHGRSHVPWPHGGVCVLARLGRPSGTSFEVYAESPVASVPSAEPAAAPAAVHASSPPWRDRP